MRAMNFLGPEQELGERQIEQCPDRSDGPTRGRGHIGGHIAPRGGRRAHNVHRDAIRRTNERNDPGYATRMAGMVLRSLNEMSNRAARIFDSLATPGAPEHRPPPDRLGAVARACLSLRGIVTGALPQTCALCADRSGDAMLCAPCMNALPALPPACPNCARPVPSAVLCGVCLMRPPKFSATVAACAYAFPLDRLVQGLKYEHRLALAEPLGDALAAALLRSATARTSVDAIVAMPLTARRQRERGFNQATQIARVVARRVGLPMLHGLARTGDAPPQATLRWRDRRRNVRGAFACRTSFAGRAVALVDDVMTTGATLEAAAGALLGAGASRVDAWVVARTLPAN